MIYHFDRCSIFDPVGDPYPHGYVYEGIWVTRQSYFFCHGYGYMIVISGEYLPIAISKHLRTMLNALSPLIGSKFLSKFEMNARLMMY
jgi:hypothetical protein